MGMSGFQFQTGRDKDTGGRYEQHCFLGSGKFHQSRAETLEGNIQKKDDKETKGYPHEYP